MVPGWFFYGSRLAFSWFQLGSHVFSWFQVENTLKLYSGPTIQFGLVYTKKIILITFTTILSIIKTVHLVTRVVHHHHRHRHFLHKDHHQDHSLVSLFDFAAPKMPTALDFVQLAEERWQF